MPEGKITLVRQDDLSYSVRIGRNILPEVLPEIERRRPSARVFVLTDANLESAGCLAAMLADREVPCFSIEPPGEVSKNLGTVTRILSAMERDRFGRDSLLVALGGGTIGDIGGFVAAIFKRGIPYVQVPTTTVAQADSAVGGKVGVDSELSKNAYGAFKQPLHVFIDVSTLATLDDRNYRAGLVESVKHAMIADADYFEYLEANMPGLLAREEDILEAIAEKNVTIKGRVVEQDPEEKNLRSTLNYGHTVGHAVESASGFHLLHGEAVAIGIVAAVRIAEELGLADESIRSRAVTLLEKLGMPTRIPADISSEAIADIMTRDKKAVGGVPRFVLLDALGKAHEHEGQFAVEVDAGAVNRALESLRA